MRVQLAPHPLDERQPGQVFFVRRMNVGHRFVGESRQPAQRDGPAEAPRQRRQPTPVQKALRSVYPHLPFWRASTYQPTRALHPLTIPPHLRTVHPDHIQFADRHQPQRQPQQHHRRLFLDKAFRALPQPIPRTPILGHQAQAAQQVCDPVPVERDDLAEHHRQGPQIHSLLAEHAPMHFQQYP